jgi:hypothetical protein
MAKRKATRTRPATNLKRKATATKTRPRAAVARARKARPRTKAKATAKNAAKTHGKTRVKTALRRKAATRAKVVARRPKAVVRKKAVRRKASPLKAAGRPARKRVAKRAAPKVIKRAAKAAPQRAVVPVKAPLPQPSVPGPVKPASPPKVSASSAVTAPVARARRDSAPKRAPARLDRARRTIVDDDIVPGPPSSLDLDRSASAARSGRHELQHRIREHTETSPELTGGDVDADWERAASSGDEAPGGDNLTPDQDVVDEIGHAVGVDYGDEELDTEGKLEERDAHRWELDPESADDFEDR